MADFANRTTPHYPARQRQHDFDEPQKGLNRYPSTAFERFMLLITIIILPLEDHLPSIGGFSVTYILFGTLACYIFLFRLHAFMQIVGHYVFLILYALIVVGLLMETIHPNSSYSELIRIALMIIGAILVATICRDKQALQTGLYGYLGAGAWMSIYLFLTIYGVLNAAEAGDFQAASRLRATAFSQGSLQANWNKMAFVAAQGATVALTFALFAKRPLFRNIFYGITLFCLVGAFLPMSRSGVVIVVISCAVVLFSFGVLNMKSLIVVLLSGVVMMWFIPDAVLSRLAFTTEKVEGKQESRARVYTAVIKHFPEYALTGVGCGNYYGDWGKNSDFARRGDLAGAHNSFAQITIYWGISGLLLLLWAAWGAYACLPKIGTKDILSLSLKGIAVSLFLLMMVKHNIYQKDFSLGVGLLVGAHCWIWNKETFSSKLVKQVQRRYVSLVGLGADSKSKTPFYTRFLQ